jgi:hypothetical protein
MLENLHLQESLNASQQTALDNFTSEATDAARRLAAKQFIKLTREPVVALLAGHLDKDDPSMRAKVAAFLDSELGEGIIAMLLSLGVAVIPFEHPEVKILASQLRIKAMTDVGDVAADLIMAPLRQVISELIKGAALPALPVATQNVTVPNFAEQAQPQAVNV